MNINNLDKKLLDNIFINTKDYIVNIDELNRGTNE